MNMHESVNEIEQGSAFAAGSCSFPCTVCKKAPAEDGRKRCAPCREKRSAYTASYRRNNPGKWNDYMRKRGDGLRDAGKCTGCGGAPRPTKKQCGPCAAAGLGRRKKYYASHRNVEMARAKAWKSANPGRHAVFQRRSHLKLRYGLTEARYNEMLAAQGGACAICGDPQPDKRKKFLDIDHDHLTGAVRGLLCTPCNVHLPCVEDVEWRTAAEAYLKGHRNEQ
jgi:Recombination endonuclease VII